MPSLFTRIIEGEIPGRFVYRDDTVVAFLTIAPLAPGHTLVVPVEEVEHWIDLRPEQLQEVMAVARRIAVVLDAEFRPQKVGMIIAGMEVPHVHVHLIPIQSESQLNFANADTDPDPAQMDEIALRISAALNR